MKQNLFNTVRMSAPKRNSFDMSYDRKFSLDAGKLVPIHVQEILPGDKINMQSMQMIRMAPMIAPVMHQVDVFTHFFFVPNRLMWAGWEQFITGGKAGDPIPVFPTVGLSEINPTTIPDYLGLPSIPDSDFLTHVSALPFSAYGMIYNEYYRDENLQAELDIECHDGDNTNLMSTAGMFGQPLKRSWEHDYFTSALPFAQKGPAVTLPLQGTADIVYQNAEEMVTKIVKPSSVDGSTPVSLHGPLTSQFLPSGPQAGDAYFDITDDNDPSNHGIGNVDNSQQLQVDLSSATATTINDLRRAMKLQEYLEKLARGGSRYIEYIKSFFGVQSSDARLQRPEYLGGGKSPVTISEVLQTSESVTTPQGNLSGHGINVGQSHSFSRSFEEHGYIIGIMSVMPKSCYQQGIPKHWNKFDNLDYFNEKFAHLGEQEIKNKELYVAQASTDENVFGYIPRYSEYRYLPSSVHGDFRDNLDYWHWGRVFTAIPALNSSFIECEPTKRIFAVQDIPDSDDSVRDFNTMYCHIFHNIQAIRPIPKYGEPMM